jgi:hypothetical protein
VGARVEGVEDEEGGWHVAMRRGSKGEGASEHMPVNRMDYFIQRRLHDSMEPR